MEKLSLWQHFKGNVYLLEDESFGFDNERIFIYRALLNPEVRRHRPVSEWEEDIIREGQRVRRFTYICELREGLKYCLNCLEGITDNDTGYDYFLAKNNSPRDYADQLLSFLKGDRALQMTLYNDKELEKLWIESFRYCLPRKTVAVSEFCQMASKHWDYIPGFARAKITQELSKAVTTGVGMGMDCDRQDWEKLLFWINEEKPWLRDRAERGASTVWKCTVERITKITENKVVVSFQVNRIPYDIAWRYQDTHPLEIGDIFMYDPTYRDITPIIEDIE